MDNEYTAVVTKDAVALKNVTRMYLPDGKRYIEYVTNCKCTADGKLSLRRIDTKVARSDKVVLLESQTVVEGDEFAVADNEVVEQFYIHQL